MYPTTLESHVRREWVVWASMVVVISSALLILRALIWPWIAAAEGGTGDVCQGSIRSGVTSEAGVERDQSWWPVGVQCVMPESVSGARVVDVPSSPIYTIAALLGVHTLLAGESSFVAEVYFRPRLQRVLTIESDYSAMRT
ncbi:hypothetical protein [Rhodococcus sp. USK13]|uniref:hypothetical protein n=1 Tax=Rhodococcus sp. USK13 TaxID=2806442 RepID=UPI001BCF10FE|nr:hypothetical protein [Rhodococcus sp. USK13]